jgi:hypothetical protein
MSPVHSIDKVSASVILNAPQSDIFPNMIKISSVTTDTITDNKTEKTSKYSDNTLLNVGLATMGGFAIGRGTAKIIERPIDNLPASLIGATVCGAAITGMIGFYIAKYGGFFDKERDFRQMFKNL